MVHLWFLLEGLVLVSGPPAVFKGKHGLWRYSDLNLNSSWASHWAIQPLRPQNFFNLVG